MGRHELILVAAGFAAVLLIDVAVYRPLLRAPLRRALGIA